MAAHSCGEYLLGMDENILKLVRDTQFYVLSTGQLYIPRGISFYVNFSLPNNR